MTPTSSDKPSGGSPERDDAEEGVTIGPADAQVGAADRSERNEAIGAREIAADEGPDADREVGEREAADADGEKPERAADDEEEPSRGLSAVLGPAAPIAWLALVAVVLAAIALLWVAGELHYQSCIDKVNAKTQGARDPLTNLVRARDLNNCSRLPF